MKIKKIVLLIILILMIILTSVLFVYDKNNSKPDRIDASSTPL